MCTVVTVQSLSNGSIDKPPMMLNSLELDGIDAADSLSRLTTELASAHAQIAELSTKIGDVEESFSSSQKELLRTQELNTKLQRDVREVCRLLCGCCTVCTLFCIMMTMKFRNCILWPASAMRSHFLWESDYNSVCDVRKFRTPTLTLSEKA